jgi:LacI family transcriptional regulator
MTNIKNITIKDVAKKAKTSVATVSNFLNNTGRMSEKTRKKISRVIDELNFHPNKTAAILSKGKSDTIAFVSSYLSSPFYNLILAGVEHGLYQSGKFRHSLEHYATRGSEAIKINLLKDLLFSKKVQATITVTFNVKREIIDEYRKRKIPIVSVERKITGALSVCCDNVSGAYEATGYLIKKGKKNIAIISGLLHPRKFDEDVSPAMSERIQGYKKALKDNGIDFRKEHLFEVNFYNQDEGKRIMQLVHNSEIKFDAIFCAAGDIVAVGMIEKAKELGIKIPGDLSIIGYDDIDMAKVIEPALTTVKQPLFEMGIKAYELVEEQLNTGNVKVKNFVFKPELIKRDSA